MRSLFTPLLLPLLLLAPGAGSAQAPYQASAPLSWELKNARWFDGHVLRQGNLYIDQGVFVAKRPAQVNRKMDLRGQQVLINPLGEAHNHNLQTAWGWGQYAQTYLDEGVFYAAMLCGDPASVAEVRPLAAVPAAPDVSFITACITSSDGYPLADLLRPPPIDPAADAAPKTAPNSAPNAAPGTASGTASERAATTAAAAAAQQQLVLVDSPEQAAAQWPAIKARGGTAIRIVLSHVDQPALRSRPDMWGRLGLSAESAAALTRLAHGDGQRVVAHVETAADFDAALAAGVDVIAHLPGYANVLREPAERFAISAAAAALAARRHTAVITTVAATDLFRMDAQSLAALRAVQRSNLARLQAAGVALRIGSDVFIGTARAEVHALDALGLERSLLLRLATQDTPRALFPQRRLGCFDPGCEASFLLLGGDPLTDLAQIDQPLLRVKQGRLLTRLADVAAASAQARASTADSAKKASGKKAGKAQATRKATAKPKTKSSAKSTAKPTPQPSRKPAAGARPR